MKKICTCLIILLLISCKSAVNKDNEFIESCYGTWCELNGDGKVIVYDLGDGKYKPYHSIRISKDSICDNWPIEQSCWKNNIISTISNDTIKVSDEFYFILSDSIKNLAIILSNKFDRGVMVSIGEKKEYIKLSLLDSFPKEIIKDEDDVSDSSEEDTFDEFYRNLDQFSKENPN